MGIYALTRFIVNKVFYVITAYPALVWGIWSVLLCFSYTETIHDIVLLPVLLGASQKIFSFFVTDHQFSFTDIISTRMLHFIRNTSLFLFYYNIVLLRGCDFSCLCTISSYLHKSTSIHTIGHNSDHVSDESSQDFKQFRAKSSF